MMRTWQHVTRGLFTLSVASVYAIGVSSCVLKEAPPRSEVVSKALPATTTIPRAGHQPRLSVRRS